MAQTEIYVRYTGDKHWYCHAEIPHASSGALRLWYVLEEKYLPSYEYYNTYDGRPDYHTDECKRTGKYNHRFAYSMGISKNNPMQKVWDLDHDPRLTYAEMVVMRSTMDDAMVIGADLELFADCLEEVGKEHGGNYLEQAEAVRKLIAGKKKVSAIAYVQTSVCCASDFFDDDMSRPMNKFWDCIPTKEAYLQARKEAGLE